MKKLSKELRRTLPENIKMEGTGTKLGSQFNIKDPIPKRHNHDLSYHTVCLQDNFDEYYIAESATILKERPKDHNGREKTHICYVTQ